MGFDVSTLVASTLGNVGQDITTYMNEQRQRRAALVDTQIEHMFTEGRAAYAERKEERKRISENLKYFGTLGFNRADIEKFASLPQADIDRIKASIQEGQKQALDKGQDFDAASFIGFTVDETGRAVTGTQPLNYNEWANQTVDGIIGTVDPSKFKTRQEENSFRDNFKRNLAKQFGSLRGVESEALAQTAQILGKKPEELQSVLEDDLVRKDIAPPQFALPYTQEESLNIRQAELSLDKLTIELEEVRALQAQNNTLMGDLEGNFTLFGEPVDPKMTYRTYIKSKELEIQEQQAVLTRNRIEKLDNIPVPVQNNIHSGSLRTGDEYLQSDIKGDGFGAFKLGSGKAPAEIVVTTAANDASRLVNQFQWTGDALMFKTPISNLTKDIILYRTYKELLQIAAGEGDIALKNVENLINKDFKNLEGNWRKEGADLSFANHIRDNLSGKVILSDLKANLSKLQALDGEANGSTEKGVSILFSNAEDILRSNMSPDTETQQSTIYFDATGMVPPSDNNNNQEFKIVDAANFSDAIANTITSDGKENITKKINEIPELSDAITSAGIDLGSLQAYLNEQDVVNQSNVRQLIKKFVNENKKKNNNVENGEDGKPADKPTGDELKIDYERVEELVGGTRFDFDAYEDKKVKLALQRNEDELKSLKEQYEEGDISRDEFYDKMKEIGNSTKNIVKDLWPEGKGQFGMETRKRERYDKNVENFNLLFDTRKNIQ